MKELFIEEHDKILCEAMDAGVPVDENKAMESLILPSGNKTSEIDQKQQNVTEREQLPKTLIQKPYLQQVHFPAL